MCQYTNNPLNLYSYKPNWVGEPFFDESQMWQQSITSNTYSFYGKVRSILKNAIKVEVLAISSKKDIELIDKLVIVKKPQQVEQYDELFFTNEEIYYIG